MATHASLRCFLALGCAAAALAGCDGPRADTPLVSEPAPLTGGRIPPGRVGETAQFALTVSGPKPCRVGRFSAEPRQHAVVGVEINLEARGDLQVPANPYYAWLVTDDDIAHEAILNGCTPRLEARVLEPAQTARGWISFEIPSQSSPREFVYAPRLAGPAQVELSFTLPR